MGAMALYTEQNVVSFSSIDKEETKTPKTRLPRLPWVPTFRESMGLGGAGRRSDGYHDATRTGDLTWTSRQRVLVAKGA